MAASADHVSESVSMQKDIQIINFSKEEDAVSNSSVFCHTNGEPFFRAVVRPRGLLNPQFVSVTVNRCPFYPRFFPGLLHGSLGWKISVVDAEGEEKFMTYFGLDEFLSLDWAEDFFRHRGRGLDEFVRRSVLLDDPERFLPRDVLTVRVEVFFDRRVGEEAAMQARGDEIQAFVVKPFLVQQVAFAETDKKRGSVPIDENTKTGCSEEVLKSTESASKPGSVGPCIPPGETDHWKTESILMMEETLHELREAFELYSKLQQLKDIVQQNPQPDQSDDPDLCPDIREDVETFRRLFEAGGNVRGTAMERDSKSWMEEPFGVAKVAQQLGRILALHKHLQMHWEKGGHKSAAYREMDNRNARLSTHQTGEIEKEGHLAQCVRDIEGTETGNRMQSETKNTEAMHLARSSTGPMGKKDPAVQSPPDIAQSSSGSENDETRRKSFHNCPLGDGIHELFQLHRETLRLAASEPEAPDHLLRCVSRFLKVFLNVIRILSLRLYWPVCVLQVEPPPPSTTLQDPSELQDPPSSVENVTPLEDGKPQCTTSTKNTSLDTEDTGSGETWYFTIETSDLKRFEIPFRDGSTTLGSLLRSASPVFDRMLDTPMLEKSERFLKLPDFDSATVSRFLSFLQSGAIDSTATLEETALLYQLAHKYQAEALVRECVAKMATAMDHLSAGEVAEFSKFYGDDALMSMVEAFRFRPRATMAVWGLKELDVTPMSSETTWAKSVEDVPLVQKAVEAVLPKEEYKFYE